MRAVMKTERLLLLLSWTLLVTFYMYHSSAPSKLERVSNVAAIVGPDLNERAQAAPRALGEDTRIAIIGAAGYIGSRLYDSMVQSGLNVVGFDRSKDAHSDKIIRSSAKQIPADQLRDFDVVIYLGGLTGKAANAADDSELFAENVEDVCQLSRKMHSGQILIFASSASVAQGTDFKQDDVVDATQLDRYSKYLFYRENHLRSQTLSEPCPVIIGLRLGSVEGWSRHQRNDMTVSSMVKSAYVREVVSISDPKSVRSVLWMKDLISAVKSILSCDGTRWSKFQILHLESFHKSLLGIGQKVASKTGAEVEVVESSSATPGYSLSATESPDGCRLDFQGTLDEVVSELTSNSSHLVVGLDMAVLHHHESVPCVVCGSRNVVKILDLGKQPLANDFQKSKKASFQSLRHPLAHVRCRDCHHTQLSYLVNRSLLFSHYLYQSGTSTTLAKYFEWLAAKVVKESGRKEDEPGTVLELACNDGTQLNKFKPYNWKTYGVDPAENLVGLAREQGHIVQTGFWGAKPFEELPKPEDLDAVIAQNVVAHTDTPVQFCADVAKVMGPKSKFYLQTSQCEMFATGQFDTVYHEHISFFTAHSFQKMGELAGLKIVGFEIVPIHGNSCLVTFQKADTAVDSAEAEASAITKALAEEVSTGVTSDWFYVLYRERALAMRSWMHERLNDLHDQGYQVGAYGAAAKGMVLMHFMLQSTDRKYRFKFVVDEAPLKQGTYCAGTDTPVRAASVLLEQQSPLVIVVFAWNFLDEIVSKISKTMRKSTLESILLVRPFPVQSLYEMSLPDGKLTLKAEHVQIQNKLLRDKLAKEAEEASAAPQP